MLRQWNQVLVFLCLLCLCACDEPQLRGEHEGHTKQNPDDNIQKQEDISTESQRDLLGFFTSKRPRRRSQRVTRNGYNLERRGTDRYSKAKSKKGRSFDQSQHVDKGRRPRRRGPIEVSFNSDQPYYEYFMPRAPPPTPRPPSPFPMRPAPPVTLPATKAGMNVANDNLVPSTERGQMSAGFGAVSSVEPEARNGHLDEMEQREHVEPIVEREPIRFHGAKIPQRPEGRDGHTQVPKNEPAPEPTKPDPLPEPGVVPIESTTSIMVTPNNAAATTALDEVEVTTTFEATSSMSQSTSPPMPAPTLIPTPMPTPLPTFSRFTPRPTGPSQIIPPWRPFRSNPNVPRRPSPPRAGLRKSVPDFRGRIPQFIINRRNRIIYGRFTGQSRPVGPPNTPFPTPQPTASPQPTPPPVTAPPIDDQTMAPTIDQGMQPPTMTPLGTPVPSATTTGTSTDAPAPSDMTHAPTSLTTPPPSGTGGDTPVGETSPPSFTSFPDTAAPTSQIGGTPAPGTAAPTLAAPFQTNPPSSMGSDGPVMTAAPSMATTSNSNTSAPTILGSPSNTTAPSMASTSNQETLPPSTVASPVMTASPSMLGTAPGTSPGTLVGTMPGTGPGTMPPGTMPPGTTSPSTLNPGSGTPGTDVPSMNNTAAPSMSGSVNGTSMGTPPIMMNSTLSPGTTAPTNETVVTAAPTTIATLPGTSQETPASTVVPSVPGTLPGTPMDTSVGTMPPSIPGSPSLPVGTTPPSMAGTPIPAPGTAAPSAATVPGGATGVPTTTAQCLDNPRDIPVGVDIQVTFPDGQFVQCDEVEQALILLTIEDTLNTVFPNVAIDWQGTAFFSQFQFDPAQQVDNTNAFAAAGLRRFTPTLREGRQSPKRAESTGNFKNTDSPPRRSGIIDVLPTRRGVPFPMPQTRRFHPLTSGQRNLQTGTCPPRPFACPASVGACLYTCGIATTTNCGTGDTLSWEFLGFDLSAALALLQFPCLGDPFPPNVVLNVF